MIVECVNSILFIKYYTYIVERKNKYLIYIMFGSNHYIILHQSSLVQSQVTFFAHATYFEGLPLYFRPNS